MPSREATDRPATRTLALVSLVVLAPLAAALLAAAPPSPPHAGAGDPEHGWRTVVALDEVVVEMESATARRGGDAATVQLRWRFVDRAVSPPAWDYGVRFSLDVVDVDCRTGATRTRSSVAFAVDGTPLIPMSFDDAEATWKRHGARSLGALVARGVCEALRAR